MTDVILTTEVETIIVNNEEVSLIVTAGEQGPMGAQGPSTSITSAPDVDVTNIQDGSLLVYSAQNQKWVANTQLNNQSLESGHY